VSYLDPKERVIDLQLTSYGKYLLSTGKLNPAYYAFFDEDIIYDASYAGVDTEEQSAIEPRIQENTPRFSSQTVYSGRELEIFNGNPNIVNDLIIGSELEDKEKIEQGLVKVQDGPEGVEVLQQPIGKTNPYYPYAPAWNVSFLKAPLSSSANYQVISASTGEIYKNIPQLNTSMRYTIFKNSPTATENIPDISLNGYEQEMGAPKSQEIAVTFEDGASISFKKDALILRIEESNTFFEKDNFEIECFEIETINNKEHLIPLNFHRDSAFANVNNNNQANYENGTIEQYFNFDVDQEIPESEICHLIKEDKINQVYQSKIFDCTDFTTGDGLEDIYTEGDDTGDMCE
tara:strand:- start:4168 stop:5208 length:1041 start_codon:yes stop_codon:yes gene_type:complete